jgi:hypothetical protein
MPIDRTRIEANGWCQGKFFTPEDATQLFERYGARVADRVTTNPDTLILASHDCDVLSHIGEDEPDVTVFPVLPLAQGQQFSPVSVHRPRAWHFEMNRAGQTVQRELLARTAFPIPRADLEGLRPWSNAALPDRYARQFAPWLGVRWHRPGFPDEFNERLRTIQSKVKREAARVSPLMRALLVDVDPFDESPRDQATPCEVMLCALMEHLGFEKEDCRRRVQGAIDQVSALMRGCKLADGSPAFTVTQSAARSMATMSVAEYNDYKNLGFEELSLRDDSALPPGRL